MLHMSEQREFWIETYAIQVVTLMNVKRHCTSPNIVNTQLYDTSAPVLPIFKQA